MIICITVRVHGWYPQADGTVCFLHHGGDWTQAACWDHPVGHQPVLIPLLHVQSGARPLYQRKSRNPHH